MTVVTPGGPCLTQTQINRNEQQARFEQKQEAKAEGAANPYGAAALQQPQTPNAVTGVENTDTSQQSQKSYGARGGGQLVDIII